MRSSLITTQQEFSISLGRLEKGELLETTIVLLASHLILLQCMKFVFTSSGEIHISYRGAVLILTRAYLEKSSLDKILTNVKDSFSAHVGKDQIPIIEEVTTKFLASTVKKS